MPKIIDEAAVFAGVLNVVVTRGYASATTAEMAAAANIHEATLFRKYGSKSRLVALAIETQLANAPLRQVAYTGDLRADLTAIAQAYLDTFDRHGPIITALLLEIPRHPELRSTMQIPIANIAGIAHIIERYQHDGLLKPEPPMVTTMALMSPLMVYRMFGYANVAMTAPDIDLDDFVAGFLHGRQRPV